MSDEDSSPPFFGGLKHTVRGVKRKLLSSLGGGEEPGGPTFIQRNFSRNSCGAGDGAVNNTIRPGKVMK
jgi:hypothetical protein